MTEVRTLEGLGGDAFWQQFDTIMGPEGLMTYRYIGSHGAVALDRFHSESTAVLRSDMRGPGGVLASALAIMGGDCMGVIDDAIAIPAPTTLSIEVLDDAVGVEEVRVHGEIVHAGRTQIFSRVRLEDAADPTRVLALGTNSAAVMGPAPEGYHYVPPGPGMPDSPSLPPLWEAFGGRRRPGGGYEIPALTGHLGSTSGSLHFGPTIVLMEAAATEAAAAAAGTDRVRATQLTAAFLKRGTTGPFVTDVEVVSSTADAIACRTSMRDDGVTGRVIAVGTVVLRRV